MLPPPTPKNKKSSECPIHTQNVIEACYLRSGSPLQPPKAVYPPLWRLSSAVRSCWSLCFPRQLILVRSILSLLCRLLSTLISKASRTYCPGSLNRKRTISQSLRVLPGKSPHHPVRYHRFSAKEVGSRRAQGHSGRPEPVLRITELSFANLSHLLERRTSC